MDITLGGIPLLLALFAFPGAITYASVTRLWGRESKPLKEVLIDLIYYGALVTFLYALIEKLLPHVPLPSLGLVFDLILKDSRPAPDGTPLGQTLLNAFAGETVMSLMLSIVIASSREFGIQAKVGALFGGRFQSETLRTPWQVAFEVGGKDNFVVLQTTQGITYCGLIKFASDAEENGAIVLEHVHIVDDDSDDPRLIARIMYVNSRDISGPILFLGAETTNSEVSQWHKINAKLDQVINQNKKSFSMKENEVSG